MGSICSLKTVSYSSWALSGFYDSYKCEQGLRVRITLNCIHFCMEEKLFQSGVGLCWVSVGTLAAVPCS